MMPNENCVVILSACRTPIGSFTGCFRTLPAHELGSIVIKEALTRANVDTENVSEIIMGQCLTGGQGQNPARLASVKAGVPVTVPAYGINMLCGSGLKAVYLAYQAIMSKEASFIVAGGQESMSLANHCALLRPGIKYGSGVLKDCILVDGLTEPNLKMHMGDTAEHLAAKYKVSRQRQDAFACSSQQKADDAIKNGYFHAEIVPVTVKGKTDIIVGEDEFPKRNTTVEILAKLSPVFAGGDERTVTPGNASGINDGAAAVVLGSADECKAKELKPMARIVAFGQTGLEPVEMGLGPIEAIQKALNKCNWKIEDVDLFELNEAFAVQSILVVDRLHIPLDKVNVCGGAIALGHPIGASGARVLVTLLHNMQRLDKKKGVAALCIGGGMGIAVAVERVGHLHKNTYSDDLGPVRQT